MTSQFSDSFHYYIPPEEGVVKAAFEGGMIVFDTNVLLSAYRFAPGARRELLSAIRKVAERIWIPNRVAEEFHRNRISVINGYDAEYGPVVEGLREAQNRIDAELVPKIEQLANRAALAEQEKRELIKLVGDSTAMAFRAVESLRKQHDLPPSGEGDTILAEFQELFEGRTGTVLCEQDLADAIAEAERRAEQRMPPGFRDAKNSEPYGDYLIWRQTLIEAGVRKCDYLLFVTGDKKDDWYQIVRGRTIGAQPQLVREAHRECGAQLVMCDATSFLFHARQYLEAEVSPETIRQSEVAAKNYLRVEVERQLRRRDELDELTALEGQKEAELERERRDEAALQAHLAASTGYEDQSTKNLLRALRLTRGKIALLDADLQEVRNRRMQFASELRDERDRLSRVAGVATQAL